MKTIGSKEPQRKNIAETTATFQARIQARDAELENPAKTLPLHRRPAPYLDVLATQEMTSQKTLHSNARLRWPSGGNLTKLRTVQPSRKHFEKPANSRSKGGSEGPPCHKRSRRRGFTRLTIFSQQRRDATMGGVHRYRQSLSKQAGSTSIVPIST